MLGYFVFFPGRRGELQLLQPPPPSFLTLNLWQVIPRPPRLLSIYSHFHTGLHYSMCVCACMTFVAPFPHLLALPVSSLFIFIHLLLPPPLVFVIPFLLVLLPFPSVYSPSLPYTLFPFSLINCSSCLPFHHLSAHSSLFPVCSFTIKRIYGDTTVYPCTDKQADGHKQGLLMEMRKSRLLWIFLSYLGVFCIHSEAAAVIVVSLYVSLRQAIIMLRHEIRTCSLGCSVRSFKLYLVFLCYSLVRTSKEGDNVVWFCVYIYCSRAGKDLKGYKMCNHYH